MIRLLCLLALVAGPGLTTTLAQPAIIDTIPITDPDRPTFPWDAAVNPALDRLYVTEASPGAQGGVVAVVNTQSHEVVAQISSPAVNLTAQSRVTVNPETHRVYVTNVGDADAQGEIVVVDGQNNSIVTSIALGEHPNAVAVDPTTNLVYAITGNGNVLVIDGSTNTVTTTIPASDAGFALAIAPEMHRLYVAIANANMVTVIDTEANSVVDTITVGDNAGGIAVDSASQRVYVTSSSGGDLTVIDASTNSVIEMVAVGSQLGVAVDPVSQRVYMTSGAGVTTVDGVTLEVVGEPVAAGERVGYLAVDPETGLIYVPSFGDRDGMVTILGDQVGVVEPGTLAFGSVMVGTTSPTQRVTVTSRGGAISVEDVAFEGDHAADFVVTDDTCSDQVLERGETCTVQVAFAPTATGARAATLTITSNAPDDLPPVTLSGTGAAAPVLDGSVEPSTLSFGAVTVGTTAAAQTVAVTSTGTAPLDVVSVAVGGSHAADFPLTDDACSGQTLAPEQTCTIVVALAPTATGARTATLTIVSNAAESLPPVTLMGTGEEAPPVVVAISGTVRGRDGQPLEGVALELSTGQTATTDVEGRYAFEALTAGDDYTVTPVFDSLRFDPGARIFETLKADAMADFTATYVRYFAEGATGDWFDTQFTLFNPDETPANATLQFQTEAGREVPHEVSVPAGGVVTVVPETLLALAEANFSTVIESDGWLVTSRTIHWGEGAYGAHTGIGVGTPRTEWYFAEGATGVFALFYLLQNPSDMAAEVEVTYWQNNAPPVVRMYTVPAHTRRTIWVNDDPAFVEAQISARLVSTNNVPIVAERAMYLSSDRRFEAGTINAAVPAPATQWYLAEGATGDFYDLFLLLANPGEETVQATVRYLVATGNVVVRQYDLAAHTRQTTWVDTEDAELAATTVAIEVTATAPILAERSMWWSTTGAWYGGHVSDGYTTPVLRWALSSLASGGPTGEEAYALIVNASDQAAEARVSLAFADGGTPATETLVVAAHSRATLNLREVFPASEGRRFGVLVETIGETPVPLTVTGAFYEMVGGQTWGAGDSEPGTPLPPFVLR